MTNFRVFFLILVCIFFSNAVFSETRCDNPEGKLISIQGNVQIKQYLGKSWQKATVNELFCTGDQIRTLQNSRAVLSLSDNTYLNLDEKSLITFKQPKAEPLSFFELLRGGLYFRSHEAPKTIEINTPFINAVHEGTEFLVRSDDNASVVTVFDGVVVANNELGEYTIKPQQTIRIREKSATAIDAAPSMEQSVPWALYYPQILDLRQPVFSGFEEIVKLYNAGRFSTALSQLGSVAYESRDSTFYVLKANLLLRFGRMQQAMTALNQSIKLKPNNASAYALKAVISLVLKDIEKAELFVNQANSHSPEQAVSHIAAAYIHESRFELDKALVSSQTAVRLEPDNALAWSRLAHIQVAMTQFDQALSSIENATGIENGLAELETVKGMIQLFNHQYEMGAETFRRAIQLNAEFPAAHFGLGLSQIRLGKLDVGKKRIDTAVALDLSNAVLRTYLGKAYYDLNQNRLAEIEFKRSITLNTEDPSPWYYQALNKQTQNQPVDALSNILEAVKLNDNRAEYRSRQSLDKDLAARTASLGRIYNDLGFEQLARIEGWKGLSIDPSNYASHRLLADNYAGLAQHSLARTSERLQAQLLQPLNALPVQPHLSEANLGILPGVGPTIPSFNEFNTLFNRNQVNLQTSGIIAENQTYGDEAIISGVWDNLAFSLGQFHFETDGFRENNDQIRDIYNVFIQAQPSHDTGLQLELTHSSFERGDLELRFFRDDFFANQRQDQDISRIRLGMTHRFEPELLWLNSVIYQNGDFDTTTDFAEINTQTDGFIAETQFQWVQDAYNIIMGAGHIYENKDESITSFGFSQPTETSDSHHSNVYLYSNYELVSDFILTAGLSVDFFERGVINRDQVNPKVGLQWKFLPSTTLRAAFFRTLQRLTSLRDDSAPSIEPTQVAGFNQQYFGISGEDSWRYGISLEHEFTSSLHAGVELSQRELDVPTIVFDDAFQFVNIRDEWTEQSIRSYVYWTPVSQWAFSLEYFFERFDRDQVYSVENFAELRTHRLPLAVNFFSETGISASLVASYVYQTGEFPDGFSFIPILTTEQSEFWVFDAALKYRLPQRYGSVSVEANNLLNESFNFQDTEFANPRFQPERQVFFKFSLSF